MYEIHLYRNNVLSGVAGDMGIIPYGGEATKFTNKEDTDRLCEMFNSGKYPGFGGNGDEYRVVSIK